MAAATAEDGRWWLLEEEEMEAARGATRRPRLLRLRAGIASSGDRCGSTAAAARLVRSRMAAGLCVFWWLWWFWEVGRGGLWRF